MKLDSNYTISDLIIGFKNRDSRSIEYLYELFYRQLVYMNVRILHDKEMAEDIASQALMNIIKSVKEFDSLEQIKAYLITTNKNLCRDYFRYKKMEKVNLFMKNYLDNHPEEPDFEFAWVRSEIVKAVYDAIETLPKQCKEIFKQFYYSQKSTKEIADNLKIAEATTRRQKSIAIGYIKLALSKKGYLKSL